MSRFARMFRRTAATSLVKQFGELITYYPNGGMVGRDIYAIIERNIEIPIETGVQAAQAISVKVRDDATYGISATEINDGRDEVKLALQAGGTLERRQITLMRDDSNGLVRFLVR